MTPERFEALAQAYGGRLARWPASELEAAKMLLADRPSLYALLGPAEALDDALDIWTVSPSPRIAASVIAAAPSERRSLRGAWALWLSGAGLAGVLGVGAMAGAALVLAGPLNVHSDSLGSLYDQTSFGDLAQLEPPSTAGVGG